MNSEPHVNSTFVLILHSYYPNPVIIWQCKYISTEVIAMNRNFNANEIIKIDSRTVMTGLL